MNVTLRQLRAFASVYRARSITRAARELGITQSTVKAHVSGMVSGMPPDL